MREKKTSEIAVTPQICITMAVPDFVGTPFQTLLGGHILFQFYLTLVGTLFRKNFGTLFWDTLLYLTVPGCTLLYLTCSFDQRVVLNAKTYIVDWVGLGLGISER